MHLPWIATIDVLIAALRAERDYEGAPDGARSVLPDSVQDRLKGAISDLERLRSEISWIAWQLHVSDSDLRLMLRRTEDLDNLERSMTHYPDQEGREGLARSVEQGGVFGPVFGAHLAAVIRGESKLKAGTQSTFREGQQRRYAVKQIATIEHLYGISKAAAIRAFAAIAFPDDPEARRDERVRKWVDRLQAEARHNLTCGTLSVDRVRHWQAFLTGVRPDLPPGYLQGQTYPDGMNSLPPLAR